MVKALLFDLDDTLLSFLKAEDYAIEKVLNYYNVPINDEYKKTYVRINLDYWHRLERKEIDDSKVISHWNHLSYKVQF